MAWVAEVDYDPDTPGQQELAAAEAEAAALLLEEAGIEVTVIHTPRTEDPAGGYVWGNTGFYRLIVAFEVVEQGEKALDKAGWTAAAANRRVELGEPSPLGQRQANASREHREQR